MGLFSRDSATHVPVVEGRTLGGDDVRLPHDLPADATLLVVTFDDALDPLADQWARLGDRFMEAHGDRFAVWETPVVASPFKHLGGLGTMGVRHQVDSEAERARTVPLFTDVKQFRKALRLKAGDVAALLVARDGRIAWRGEGDIDMDEVAGLEAALADVLDAPAPSPEDHPDVEPEDPESRGEPASADGPSGVEDDRDGADEGEARTGEPAAAADDDAVEETTPEADAAAAKPPPGDPPPVGSESPRGPQND